MNYLTWDRKTVTDFSEKFITEMYDRGYVFTRVGKGIMHQTRSVRINLAQFQLSSENRRILRKTESVKLESVKLPFSNYNWEIGKLGKDFYEKKFGPGVMSASKIKEMCSDSTKSNFNALLEYSDVSASHDDVSIYRPFGYVIIYSNPHLLHYSYPFYDLESPKDMGLGMMIRAIEYANNTGLKHIYLGSLQRSNDTYKLQFKGLEWFDGEKWSSDEGVAREILTAEVTPSNLL